MTAELLARRGTTNGNARGSVTDRARRRAWLVATYRADRDLFRLTFVDGLVVVDHFVLDPALLLAYETVASVEVVPSCRCYRCGTLLTVETVTVDRIVPGVHGGTYRRSNIRPACSTCNSSTGATVRRKR